MKKDKHGANLFELSKKYNFKIEDIKDFSSNINPLGPSQKAIKKLEENLNLITTYPDPNYIDLKNSISKYVCAKPENIFLGSGTTQLFREYISMLKPEKSLILSPCYSEYEKELNKINSDIYNYELKDNEEFKIDISNLIEYINKNSINLFIFANPNNPTGTILSREEIEEILKNTSAKLLVDETYVEFTNQKKYSSVPLTEKYENLFVARGVSKFFASPGIRLGYGITSDEKTKEEFSENSMLWNITILSDIMGTSMFSDTEYQKKVYKYIKSEREFIIKKLSEIKEIKVFNSEGNFVLCKILNSSTAKELRERLLKDALVIRDCASFKGLSEKYFRFCILDEKNDRKLVEKIKENI